MVAGENTLTHVAMKDDSKSEHSHHKPDLGCPRERPRWKTPHDFDHKACKHTKRWKTHYFDQPACKDMLID